MVEGEQVQGLGPGPEPGPGQGQGQVREQASGVGEIWVQVGLEEKVLGDRRANNEEASCQGSAPRNSWVDRDRNLPDRRPSARGDTQGKGSGHREDPSRVALGALGALAALTALDCAAEAAGEAHVVDEVGVDREENETQVEIEEGIHRAENCRGWVDHEEFS